MGVLKSPCVLLIGHDRELSAHFEMLLGSLGYRIIRLDNSEDGRSVRASASRAHGVLIDVSSIADRNGVTALNEIRSVDSVVPVIMISSRPNSMAVVRAMKSGATNFLFGEVRENELRRALEFTIDPRSSRRTRPTRFSAAAKQVLFGDSPQIGEVRAIIEQLHWSDAPVLIRGEIGTGKAVLAREMHAHSARAGTRFFKVNCSKLKPDRLNRALFGSHEPSAAGHRSRPGIFESDARGTLLIEEIGEMDATIQWALSKVLRDSSCRQIGAPPMVRADVRIIATTSADLEKAVVEGRFNSELYEYLSVIKIEVPSLRDRVEDILPLTEFLIRASSGAGVQNPAMTEDLKHAITAYNWPGNVQELKGFIQQFLRLGDARAAALELQRLQGHRSAGMHNSN